MTREELLSSTEYWKLDIQMELFDVINKYIEDNNLTKKQLADKLGVSKGYITQILNGEFDHRISKLVELSLLVGKAPVIVFKDIEQVIAEDKIKYPDTEPEEIIIGKTEEKTNVKPVKTRAKAKVMVTA